MTTYYFLENIRTLLIEGFTDRELRRLCYDIPSFRPVYNQLAENTGKADIVDQIIIYTEQKLQFDILLAYAKKHNLARYKEHQPYYEEVPTESATSDNNGKKGTSTRVSHIKVPSPTSYSGLVEKKASLQSELVQRHRNLNMLREQASLFAAGETPLNVINQIKAESLEIQNIQGELEKLEDKLSRSRRASK